jgi:hypothetical protein
VALNLYLDDCSNSNLLAELLQRAGHTVVRPTDAGIGLDGADDDVHFAFAIENDLTIITKNPADFYPLHEAVAPNHPGILGVYQDNDVSRDMSDAEIVRAIANVEATTQQGGDPIAGHFFVLNEWRY